MQAPDIAFPPHGIYIFHKKVERKKERGKKFTPFMVFSVMYTFCEGPILDACKSQSVTSANSSTKPTSLSGGSKNYEEKGYGHNLALLIVSH